jgi:hypothetical protein
MNNHGELRATSDMMLDMLERLRAAEQVKRGHLPGTREFAELAFEVLELSRMVTRWAEHQLQQANERLAEVPSTVPLAQTAKRRLDEVLAEWRQAEMQLSVALPGSPDYAHATTSVERLREEYRALQAEKMGGHAEQHAGREAEER